MEASVIGGSNPALESALKPDREPKSKLDLESGSGGSDKHGPSIICRRSSVSLLKCYWGWGVCQVETAQVTNHLRNTRAT